MRRSIGRLLLMALGVIAFLAVVLPGLGSDGSPGPSTASAATDPATSPTPDTTPTQAGQDDEFTAGSESPSASERLAGPDRYGTAAAIAVETFPNGAETVVLARGDDFPDALSASALAGVVEGPLLLTSGESLSTAAADAIVALGADDVILLGGAGAINAAVADEARALGLDVRRIAGPDRYATANAVAEEVAAAGIGSLDGDQTAFVASGEDYPDAIAAGGAASASLMPVFLSPRTALPTAVEEALQSSGVERVVLLGGTSALTVEVERQIADLGIEVERIGGATRLETSTQLADFVVARLGFAADTAVLVRGDDYPDALAGGPFAAAAGAPILLIGSPQNIGDPAASWLAGECDRVSGISALGSTGAIENSVIQAATEQIECGEVESTTQAAEQLLTPAQQSFDGSVVGWEPRGNTTIAHDETQGRNDAGSLVVTVDAAGPFADDSETARVSTLAREDALPAVAGEHYEGSWWIQPLGEPRSVRCELRWYDDGGGILGTDAGPTVEEATDEWVRTDCSATAPAGTTRVALRIFIDGASYGETHLVDDASLLVTDGPAVPVPTATPDEPAPAPAPTTTPTPTPTAIPTPTPVPPGPGDGSGSTSYPDGPGDTGFAAAGLSEADLVDVGSLTPGSGDVIDGVHVTGSIILEDGASGVIIRNSLIEATGNFGIRTSTTSTDVVIENVTIRGVGSADRTAAIRADGAGRITGVDASGFGDGIKVNRDFIVEDSWIHDLQTFDGSHNDGIQSQGGQNVIIRNNRIEGPYQRSTSAMLLASATVAVSDYTVTGNFLSGGNFSIYVSAKDGFAPPSGMRVEDNTFDGLSADSSTANPANSWRWGPCRLVRGEGFVFSGNVFRDGSPAAC